MIVIDSALSQYPIFLVVESCRTRKIFEQQYLHDLRLPALFRFFPLIVVAGEDQADASQQQQ